MKVNIHGKQMDLGDSLKSFIDETVISLGEKYFGKVIDADVAVEKKPYEYRCSISVRVGDGTRFHAEGNSDDVHESVKDASDRLDKQMRRQNRKNNDHHRGRTTKDSMWEMLEEESNKHGL